MSKLEIVFYWNDLLDFYEKNKLRFLFDDFFQNVDIKIVMDIANIYENRIRDDKMSFNEFKQTVESIAYIKSGT